MPPLRITCTHCQRTSTVDSARLPDHPVAFRCPGCQGKVVVDKAKLLAGDGATERAAAAAAPAPAATAAGAGAPPAAPPAPAAVPLELPPGVSLPPGILVSENPATGERLRALLESFDATLEPLATVEEARRRALVDPPPLLVYVAGAIGTRDHAPLAPLVALPPRERRRTFLVLVADDVTTLDGNRAFLLGVDLLIASADLERAPAALYAALEDHRRVYGTFLAALGEAS